MVSYVLIAAFTVDIAAFIAGTAISWSSPEAIKFNSSSPFGEAITDSQKSLIASLLAVGAIFGPFVFGYLVDMIGRKIACLLLGVPFLVSYVLLAFSKTVPLFYVARFIIGMGVGGVFTILPMYIGEIATESNRGAMGSAMNCFVTGGLLFSYALGPYLSVQNFNIVLAVFPALFLVLFFLLGVEAPHYLISKGKKDAAQRSLTKLRGQTNLTELDDIQLSIEKSGKGSLTDIFRDRGLIKAFIISVALVAFQQLSGINAVLFFAQTIFESSGSSIPSELCSIIIGVVQFLTSFTTPLLADRLGRKILLIFSAIGMLISEVALGMFFYLKDQHKDVSAVGWLPVVALVVYIITYNCGFGPLPWAVMGELFPPNVKSVASSATASICWFLGFLIAYFFQDISNEIGMGQSFWLFSGFCGLALCFCLFYLMETKGKNVDEIQEMLSA